MCVSSSLFCLVFGDDYGCWWWVVTSTICFICLYDDPNNMNLIRIEGSRARLEIVCRVIYAHPDFTYYFSYSINENGLWPKLIAAHAIARRDWIALYFFVENFADPLDLKLNRIFGHRLALLIRSPLCMWSRPLVHGHTFERKKKKNKRSDMEIKCINTNHDQCVFASGEREKWSRGGGRQKTRSEKCHIYYSNLIVSKNVFHVQPFDKDKIHSTTILPEVMPARHSPCIWIILFPLFRQQCMAVLCQNPNDLCSLAWHWRARCECGNGFVTFWAQLMHSSIQYTYK